MVDEIGQTLRYAQPFEIESEIIQKTNAKLEITPEIKLKIIRRLENADKIIELVDNDVTALVEKAKNALKILKEG